VDLSWFARAPEQMSFTTILDPFARVHNGILADSVQASVHTGGHRIGAVRQECLRSQPTCWGMRRTSDLCFAEPMLTR